MACTTPYSRIAAKAFLVLSGLRAGGGFRVQHTIAAFQSVQQHERPYSSTVGALWGTRYEVCLSPGCVADGAVATLHKLQAFAPPGDEVVTGACCSLCGNGPIVMTCQQPTTPAASATTKHRRIKGNKLLSMILQQGHDESVVSKSLVEAYEKYELAGEAMKAKDYETAVRLFGDATRLGYSSAIDLQETRKAIGVENISSNGIPVALLWLVDLRNKEALAKLELGDWEGALASADSACELASGQDMGSLEVLAQIQQARGDSKAERHALTKLVALMDDRTTLSVQEANRLRQLGFRLQKLEREVP
jgi:hypothetical protein